MPLARIDLAEGKTTDYRRTMGEVVYNARVEVLKAPKDDRFQVIAERPVQDFIFAPSAGVSARGLSGPGLPEPSRFFCDRYAASPQISHAICIHTLIAG